MTWNSYLNYGSPSDLLVTVSITSPHNKAYLKVAELWVERLSLQVFSPQYISFVDDDNLMWLLKGFLNIPLFS